MKREKSNQVFEDTSFLYGVNSAFIEELYARYQNEPDSVDPSWQAFFEDLGENKNEVLKEARGASWKRRDWPVVANGELVSALDTNWPAMEAELARKIETREEGLSQEEVRAAALDSVRAIMMIRAYRIRGHLKADLDPLGLVPPTDHPELDPGSYGFTDRDMDRDIFLDNVLGLETASLREIVDILERTYCSTIGVEYMHISDPIEKAWIQERIEGRGKEVSFTHEGKRAILNKLIEAENFEKFLATKYVGTKRFGLEGAEALIPAMEQIMKRGGALGAKEVVLGMPHRGRLNVLATVMMKPYRAIFHEFKGGAVHPDDVEGSGDVKYHLGTSADREFDGNKVHLSLTANPSHLEAVDPVVLGKARAKQEIYGRTNREAVIPVLLHGDAAFAGQGIVAECFGLSGLKGHRTGGTIHIIVNNQIGFTTAPHHSRSSPYPSDVAKMVQAPILHVNGDDPEAVIHCVKVATEYRQKFKKDVVVDMFCYRRHGHNEGDEPSFTQPLMYKLIRDQKTTVEIYSGKLVEEGLFSESEIDQIGSDFKGRLDQEFEASDGYRPNKADWLEGRWAGLSVARGDVRRGDTDVSQKTLREIGRRVTEIPEGFNAHRILKRIFNQRREAIENGEGIDWATAEFLAFGSLLKEGHGVRLVGQDSSRGTFSQRHSAIVDQQTEERYEPLNNLGADQAPFEVVDSLLSEAAVLGFEYGYSLAEPDSLVLWEAQFGDFANGAQTIIDQFIFSGERKWLRMSGLVLLLPHGYEGQGPEHSSARLERYLQMCAEDNVQVANCTTPANYFHILRRQMHRNFRKPLILMTPKSLLRHKRCISDLDDFSSGSSFHRVLWDDADLKPDLSVKLKPDEKIRRVVLCSGKIYYDLFEAREEEKLDDVVIYRIEQLYPFPAKTLVKELGRFPNADFVWCQEEPRNMGAWTFVEPNLEWVLSKLDRENPRARYAGRPPSAATATGLASKHEAQQKKLVSEAISD